MLAKHWKLLVVIGILVWSVLTLFRFVPDRELARLEHLASLSPADLQKEVLDSVQKLPGWDKMNNFEREDTIKRSFEEAQFANNIQVLGHMRGYAVFTNLKLGLDLRGGSQLLLQALPSRQVPEITPEVMRGVETVINNRVNSLGVSETVVQRQGRDRLIVELPGVKDPQEAKDRIGTTALLEFKELLYEPDGRPMIDSMGNYQWKDVGLT